MWKLANIIPIPKPNKDTNMGTSYKPLSLLSVVAQTLEKCLLPYITANITQTPTQHGYKAQHSTVTVLHTLNHIRSEDRTMLKLLSTVKSPPPPPVFCPHAFNFGATLLCVGDFSQKIV